MRRPIKWIKTSLKLMLFLWLLSYLIPQNLQMPVQGASSADYNAKSFWHYPWGRSGTHKGVDIFASTGTPIQSATWGLVLSRGSNRIGGKYVLILGPKWRLHYYAHLHTIQTSPLTWVTKNDRIGTVGASGNAAGKPPHLHYTIMTPIPYPWRIDDDPQGWKKMFYLNPLDYFPED